MNLTIHILLPFLGTLNRPPVLALPRVLPSGSDLHLSPKPSCHCETSTPSGSELFLAQRCPLISLIWLLLYPAGFLDVPGYYFTHRNMQQIASKYPFIPLLVSQLELKYREGVLHLYNM